MPGSGGYQQWLAYGHGLWGKHRLQRFAKRHAQRLGGVRQRFAVHVFMEQTQAIKVKRVVVITRFMQQVECAFQGVEQVSADIGNVGQG